MSETVYYPPSVVLIDLEFECNKHGLREFCRIKGLDPGHVSKIIHLKKPLSENVAKAVGYEQVIIYKKAGESNDIHSKTG